MYYKIVNKKKRIATAIADIFGYALWAPMNIFKKKAITPKDIKEILIIRTAYIGDVVMTLPILKPLKELYPDVRISFLTGSRAKEILENNPFVDEILTYNAFWFHPSGVKKVVRDYLKLLRILRAKRYDLVIEARADIRDIALLAYLSKSGHKVSYKVGGGGYLLTHVVPFKEIKHKVDYHMDIARYLGVTGDGIEWGIYLTREEKDAVEVLLSKAGIVSNQDFLVGIHPGGRKVLKCWAMDRFAKVADYLISEYGAKIIFTGSSPEKKLIDDIIMKKMEHDAVNFSGKTNLRILSGLIEKLGLFICNDTAPLHIASVMKTPTVAIFGPSKRKETGPYGNIHKVVEKEYPCRDACDENVCRHTPYNECLTAITPDDVCHAAENIMKTVVPKNNSSNIGGLKIMCS